VSGWRIAVAGYRQVLEDRPEFCPESQAEYSDHGEKWADEIMYTRDMLDARGKPEVSKAGLTTEQANALRAAGRAGGIIIHLLGLAPAGYLASSDSGP
jgi:hypothetical protein